MQFQFLNHYHVIFRARRPYDQEYFTISSNTNGLCNASVGVEDEMDYLSVDPSACDQKTIYDELLHILGLRHEELDSSQKPSENDFNNARIYYGCINGI